MKEYHKIQTVFKRDPDTKFKTLLENDFSLPEFEYLKENTWIFTEKIDGTNIRVMYDGTAVSFAGKTDRAEIPGPLLKKLTEKFTSQVLKEVFNNTSACLYGEGYGAKIQKGGGNYRKDQDFVLFDVKIDDWWLQRKDVEGIAGKLQVEKVPIIGEGNLQQMVEKVKNGFDSIWGNFRAEGIVARPAVELKARNGNRIITKLKCRDFK